MSGSALTGGVNAAFLGVNDLQAHLDLYVAQLGWEVVDSGVIDAAAAQTLWGEGVTDVRFTELRAAGSGHGRLILLAVPEQPEPDHPTQADTGLLAINMYTRDIQVTHQELSESGRIFRTRPATWSVPLGDELVSVTQVFLLAPDGVDIVFVEPAAARGTAAWDAEPDRHYTELTSVVCHVSDFEAEATFWGPGGLGLEQWYDVSFSHAGLDEMAQLPPGSELRLTFLAGPTTARLEITRLANRDIGIDMRARQRTARHLGHTGWLFLVPDLDETLARVRRLGGTVLSEVQVGPEALFGGARVAFVNTPNGLPVTFQQVVESDPSTSDRQSTTSSTQGKR